MPSTVVAVRCGRVCVLLLAAAAVFTLLAPLPVAAQAAAPAVNVGTRVRLTVPCGAGDRTCRVEGPLAHLGSDTITLTVRDELVYHRLSTVRRVEVSQGRRSYALAGAGIGFVAGALLTYAALASQGTTDLCADQSTNQDASGPGLCIGLAALGGVAGAGLGALLGGLSRGERWTNVPVERVRVGLWRPTRHSTGLAVAVAF